jgi:hypothetical protein
MWWGLPWILPRIVTSAGTVKGPDLGELAEAVERLPTEVRAEYHARFLDEPKWTMASREGAPYEGQSKIG